MNYHYIIDECMICICNNFAHSKFKKVKSLYKNACIFFEMSKKQLLEMQATV